MAKEGQRAGELSNLWNSQLHLRNPSSLLGIIEGTHIIVYGEIPGLILNRVDPFPLHGEEWM